MGGERQSENLMTNENDMLRQAQHDGRRIHDGWGGA